MDQSNLLVDLEGSRRVNIQVGSIVTYSLVTSFHENLTSTLETLSLKKQIHYHCINIPQLLSMCKHLMSSTTATCVV